MNRSSLLRIIDVNTNRASEGIRVSEDICRLALESKSLQSSFHALRFRLNQISRKLESQLGSLLNYRNIEEDSGADRKGKNPHNKSSLAESFQANCHRAQEGIRVIEEMVRLVYPRLTGDYANLRYELYALEQKTLSLFPTLKWKNVGLYFITDSRLSMGRSIEYVVTQAVLGGVQAIQLRDPELDMREKLRLGKKIRAITNKHNILFIVNDRPDLALALEADGVHLGQDDFPVNEARKIVGQDMIIGKSTHSLAQALIASRENLNYISIGPIFPTLSKKDALPPVGIKILHQIRKRVNLPIVAIGGIKKDNVKEIIELGADAVAVISALASVKNIREETREIVAIIRKSIDNKS